MYMAHNIQVKERKYTLGLLGTINKLGVRGQCPSGTVQVRLESLFFLYLVLNRVIINSKLL